MIGLVDPLVDRAEAVLAGKRKTPAAKAYEKTIVYPSVQAATTLLAPTPPQLVLLGCPPAFRGTTEPSRGFNTEKIITDAFPSCALFVEKPVGTGSVEQAKQVADMLESRPSNLVSVGYMLRYSAAVQRMKQIIKDNNLVVMMTSARYVMGQCFALYSCWWP